MHWTNVHPTSERFSPTHFLGCSLPTNFSILITSRRELDIESALKTTFTSTICLQSSDVDADVRVHVSNAISRDKRLQKWKPAIREEILEAIVEGSHGMFRWAVCQLDTIKKCLTPAMVRAELKRMPQTLHQTYDRILQAVDEMHQPFVQNALRWLAFASRPLTLQELSEASVIDPESDEFDLELSRLNDESLILELCGTLITSSKMTYVRGTDDWLSEKVNIEYGWTWLHSSDSHEFVVVSLSHYSVKEYIESQKAQNTALANYRVSSTLANTFLAECCLLYLLNYNGGEKERDFKYQVYHLLTYSARNWIEHWKLANRDEKLHPPQALPPPLRP
jgi:hypothetical protein